MRSIEGGKSRPLMVVTEGYHYHTVTAAREASRRDRIRLEGAGLCWINKGRRMEITVFAGNTARLRFEKGTRSRAVYLHRGAQLHVRFRG
ncbi:MAG: hypothetical protein ACLRSW_11985 [Christensenellaceae bacterium]